MRDDLLPALALLALYLLAQERLRDRGFEPDGAPPDEWKAAMRQAVEACSERRAA